jgi:mono/diheme cytochrome c family protein
MQHPPDRISPIPGIPDVFDFPRDVQPILDRHCLACHGSVQTPQGGPNAGGVLLDGGRGPIYSISYVTLTQRAQFSDGRDAGGNRAPRTIGSSASPLLKILAGGHHDVKASAAEQQIVRLWIETGAPYPGTYAALGSGMIPPVGNSEKVRSVFEQRCNECHDKEPRSGGALNFDTIFNFTEPEKSLALLMPLASEAGGNGRFHKGRKSDDQAIIIFKDKSDPDYQTLLEAVVAGKTNLGKIKRFDMPGFLPNEHYLREMKNYGVLPEDFDPKNDPLDPYELDRRYWKSMQHQPVNARSPSSR